MMVTLTAIALSFAFWTILSKKISTDLKQKGFRFVGPTVVYSFMQAIGMVNDHLESCFRHSEVILKHP